MDRGSVWGDNRKRERIRDKNEIGQNNSADEEEKRNDKGRV